MDDKKRNILKYAGIALIVISIGTLSYHFINNYFVAQRESELLASWDIQLEDKVPVETVEESISDVPQEQVDTEQEKTTEEPEKIIDPEKKLPFKIIIPKIGVEWIVNKGTDPATLRKGPGFYLSSTLPGETGTTVVCGHRTTYGAPFNKVDELEEGDKVILQTLGNEEFIYLVTSSIEVLPTDMSILENTGFPSLILSTCTPKYFATRRLIIFAEINPEEQQSN